MKCTNCGREPRSYETPAAKQGQPPQFPAIINAGGRQWHMEGFRCEGDSVESAVLTCSECCEKAGVTVVNKLETLTSKPTKKSAVIAAAASVLRKGKGGRQ